MTTHKTAIIIGAGPAGLTAAYELIDKTNIVPIVFEATGEMGGISRTVRYKGNRIDLGGHRFFSKSDRVRTWWMNILPWQGAPAQDDRILAREVELATRVQQHRLGAETTVNRPAPDPEMEDEVMLVRNRLSRILFQRKFFDYPISLSRATLANLGFSRVARMGASYLRARCFQIDPVQTLEDFYINQFGAELYRTFFRDYTQKVWGVSCQDIPADWGAQRVKGLSLSKILQHALKRRISGKRGDHQKQVETSLIESFNYPKFGPGQLWEAVAAQVQEQGGQVHLHNRITGVFSAGRQITGVEIENKQSGERSKISGDYFVSTMPVCDLVAAFRTPVPGAVQKVSKGLPYRDFITVGVLAKRLLLRNTTNFKTIHERVPDNWIYIQEPDVHVGRLQIFNNWSPYLVANQETVWVGMEYFLNEGDELWRKPDAEFARMAVGELSQIGAVDSADVLDTTVIRVPKAYPAYFGTYPDFQVVRDFMDQFENLFMIGRNGMHRYNNMDHSMLAAMTAVENIKNGNTSKTNLWAVNVEEDYHETKLP